MRKTGIGSNPLLQATTQKHKNIIIEKPNSIRCTHYLPQDTVKKIQKIKFDLLNTYNIQASISKIVEIAIDMSSKDLDINKQDSVILKSFSKKRRC